MSKFVKAGGKLINLDNVVEIEVTEARAARHLQTEEEAAEYGYPLNNYLPARDLTLEVVTTATTSSYDDGGDYPEFKHTDFHPYVIRLTGDDAEEFLKRVYVPAPNGSQPATVMAGS